MSVLISIAIVATVCYLMFRHSRRRLYELSEPVPGRPMWPLIGNAHQFAGTTKDIMSNLQKIVSFTQEHGGISKTWLGPKLYYGITDPVAAEVILTTEMSKAGAYGLMKSWLGNGLICGSVPVWKHHRKMVNPAFGQRVLDGFVSIFTEQSAILVERMAKEVDQGPFDVFKYVSPCTLDIVCESAMGVKMNAQDNQNAAYIQASIDQMELVYQRMFQIWLQPQWIFNMTKYRQQEKKNLKILLDFTETIVKKKMEQYKKKRESIANGTEYVEEEKKYKAFLDTMLELFEGEEGEEGSRWTEAELREEVDTMTIAGNDTSAHASCFVLKALACLPHVQAGVHRELADIFGETGRPIHRDDLPRMEYLERVIKETLRLFPLVPIVVRAATRDILLDNYTIPAGAECVVSPYGLHTDARVWGEQADRFDPDRFLPEEVAKRHPCSYIPFSAGPRNCIGKRYALNSIKCVVASVVRAYELTSDESLNDVRGALKAEVLMKPVHGHTLRIRRRRASVHVGCPV